MWAGVIAINVVRGLGGPLAFGAISLIMNNMLSRNLGLMNGLATSCASLARAMAPAACGGLYTSAAGGTFPFDATHAPFYVLCVVAILTITLTVRFREVES